MPGSMVPARLRPWQHTFGKWGWQLRPFKHCERSAMKDGKSITRPLGPPRISPLPEVPIKELLAYLEMAFRSLEEEAGADSAQPGNQA